MEAESESHTYSTERGRVEVRIGKGCAAHVLSEYAVRTVRAYECLPCVAVVKLTVKGTDSQKGRRHSTAICIRTSSPPKGEREGGRAVGKH